MTEAVLAPNVEAYLRAMPKVELHVHLEGSIRPATLLTLARRNQRALPYDTVEGLSQWYQFTDFLHFIDVYVAITQCLRTPDDIELIAWEFLQGQAAQNVRHSEVTYTPRTVYNHCGIAFSDQMAALNRARERAARELGVSMALITDIARDITVDEGMHTARWAVATFGAGVDAFGLGGNEVGHPPSKHLDAFNMARAAGLPSVPHAGETVGPESIWGAIRHLGAQRIGHGVRCMEDPALVEYLRMTQIPLEVCPTSNVCLKVFPDMASHSLPRMVAAGLYITINSDDPPLFSTTLNDEYVNAARAFGFDAAQMEHFSLNALRASLLPPERRHALEAQFLREFARLRAAHGVPA